MSFIARINIAKNTPPVRAYVHECGFAEVYRSDFLQAQKYLTDVLLENPLQFQTYQFILAVMWGFNKREMPYRMIDFCGLNDLPTSTSAWPGNPNVWPFVFQNGARVQHLEKTHATCGDGLIIFGREESYRRTCASLEEYATSPPVISELEGRLADLSL